MAGKTYNSGWGFFGYSDYDTSPRSYNPKPRVVKRKPAAKPGEDVVAEKVAPYRTNGRPLFLMVSLRKQRISVFDENGRIQQGLRECARVSRRQGHAYFR